MPKFIIIDQSLQNLHGHHYEYDVSVAEAAARLGYEPIIVSNKEFPKHLYPGNIRVMPEFSRDWFGIKPPSKNRLIKLLKSIKNSQIFNIQPKKTIRFVLKVAYEYLFFTVPYFRSLLPKLKNSIFQVQNALESDFYKLFFPLYIAYQIFLNSEKFLRKILPLETFLWLIKLFVKILKKTPKLIKTTIKKLLNKILGGQKLVFANELKLLFKKLNLTSEDHIFIHTIGVDQLEELLGFITANDRNSSPHYHILLRRDCNEPIVTSAKGIGLKACINRFYGAGLWNKTVTFYTDTDELTKQHNELSPICFVTAPIPFRHENIKDYTTADSLEDPIHIIYLGDARPEKGYQYLPQLIDILWFSYIQPGKVKLTIQSNFNIPGGEPGIQEARLRLDQYPSHKVRLLKELLSTEDYYELLASADIVVIPYQPDCYAVRSSGILVESLAAGKPVVVPAKSWMASQINESRASVYDSPNQIADAVVKIVKNFQQFSQAAFEYRSLWRAKHSPDALVKCLITQDTFVKYSLDKSVPSIIYIIDGDSIVQNTGSGQVARNQLDYLSRCGYRVYGVFFFYDLKLNDEEFADKVSLAKKTLEDFNLVESWFLRYKFPLVAQSGKNINYIISKAENKTSLELDIISRSYVEIPQSLAGFVKTQKIDAVLLNYISNWPILQKLGLDQHPVICEMVDIQSHQYAFYNNREVDSREFDLECKLLEKCAVVIANNLKELEKIQEVVPKLSLYQVPYIGRLLPPKISDLAGCVDLAEVFIAGGTKNYQAFAENYQLKQKKSIDILYVSSYHFPNIYSLKWFFYKVYLPYLADKGVTFAIAGNIMNGGDLGEINHPNIFVTGSLETLRPLYAATRLVILPIKMGAGFNIKTIEALSMGKPVVSTSMALRGLEFDPELFPCFDDPEDYAARIIQLLENPKSRIEQAKKGYQMIQGIYNQVQYDKSMNLAFEDALGEYSLTPPPVETSYWEPCLVEWNQEIQIFNQIIRQFLSQETVCLEDWKVFKADSDWQNNTIFQELYDACVKNYANYSKVSSLELPTFNEFIETLEEKTENLSIANYSLTTSNKGLVNMKSSEFKYKHSYLDYYDLLTNYDLFANIVARILKQCLSQNELRLGFVGNDPAFLHIVYSLNEYGYVISGLFAGENKTELHPQQSIETIKPSEFDIIFLAQSLKLDDRNYLNKICQNTQVRVIELPQIVAGHLQVLMSVDRAKFISCLNPRKLSVISLCNALAPKKGCFVECGVYLGGTTIYISKHNDYLGINRKLFALDTYEGMPEPVFKDGDTPFKAGLFNDNQLDRVASYYKAHNVSHNIKMVKGLVQNTLPNLELNEPIALAFLDMDQYAGTKAALDEIIPCLHPDGIIVLDDTELDGVDIAVKEALAVNQNIGRIKVVQGFDILYNKNSQKNFSNTLYQL
ncbi:glycosyltransferase [Nostoc sp. ChiQUE01b]|uniref:glycosyltransferase n=1 Tax=Nostoc sp. ChiQUE01b TaxID=3075376 RepID=UPI002AD26A1F|nr:glycosyltransferase [Nostoc sp. ChiQUE01b]MDZ8260895.1 glycosyltransferase [Nostoc sp. ChiQUE01b]